MSKPADWRPGDDLIPGSADVCAGPIYHDGPIPEGITPLVVYVVTVAAKFSERGDFSLFPLSPFHGTLKEAEDALQAQREQYPRAVVHEVVLLFSRDDPAQMAELDKYREQLGIAKAGMQ